MTLNNQPFHDPIVDFYKFANFCLAFQQAVFYKDIDNMYYSFNYGKIIEISVNKNIVILILKNKLILWPSLNDIKIDTVGIMYQLMVTNSTKDD